jgi:hypothetical protein
MAPQSYYIGGKIRASDLSAWYNDLNNIVGVGVGDSGYGQSQLYTDVSHIIPGYKIKSEDWDRLLVVMHHAARHQGTSITVPTDVNDPAFPGINKVIEIITDLEFDMNSIISNKLNANLAYMTLAGNKLASSNTYYDPQSGTPTWTGTVFYEFNATFADEDTRRHFFNTGGEVRIDNSLTNVDISHAQSVAWEELISTVGVIKFAINTTSSTGEVGTPGPGFTSLTTSYELVYTKGGTADYAQNQINVYAKLSGTNEIDFKISFDDAHLADSGTWENPPDSGSWTGTDYVAGTLTVSIGDLYADDTTTDGVALASTLPTYSHITEL